MPSLFSIVDSITFVSCEEGENRYQCRRCGNTYDNKQKLIEHASTQHIVKSNTVFNCSLCQYSSIKQKKAIEHFEQFHNIVLETETMVFASFEEFEIWKRNKEQETCSSYINCHGSYKTNDFVKFKYFCHRSGLVRRQGKGVRRTRKSKKIGTFCPSRMEAIVKIDKCEVIFVKTHIGHN